MKRQDREMLRLSAAMIAFLGGFAIMVLEIIGARYLAKDFGSSFYVWVSQIGVVLIALAVGYYTGGALADRFPNLGLVALLLVPAGALTFFIPDFAGRVIDALIMRHPTAENIPPVWQKIDPALGSALVFLLPCSALATISPCLIRIASTQLTHVGKTSGLIIAISTIGSIAGVFVSGYVLIDQFSIPMIFRGTGVLTVLLGLACLALARAFRQPHVRE